ncbi:MAG TPA: hypothetical protein VN157_17675, partial [Caulobacter sp.]|nr:hypothetical protein [Caulobacter sp.]
MAAADFSLAAMARTFRRFRQGRALNVGFQGPGAKLCACALEECRPSFVPIMVRGKGGAARDLGAVTARQAMAENRIPRSNSARLDARSKAVAPP